MKRTKNQVSQNASLRSGPLPGKAGKTTGYGLLRLRKSQLCKIPDVRTAAQGHQFYLLSPEAVRLTL